MSIPSKAILFLLLLFPFIAEAQKYNQRPDSASGGRGRGNGPKIGRIYGSVRDEENHSVPYAAVAVLSVRDSSVVGGVQSNEKGNFLIDELPMGRFMIRVSFIGFQNTYSQQISLNPQSGLEIDAGVIKMKSLAQKLKDVEVTAEKVEYVNSIDRKVYNVEKNIVNTGGTVTEVLNNIPSVNVDIDGKVALRGSENVTILIDGKPSGVLGGDRRAVLQQIPASAVEQIEVLTNPSAKYDADGMAGIINIKTKKEKMRGTNGNFSAGVGTNDKYNFNIGGNNRSPRTNVYTNYVFRHERRWNNSRTDQFNFLPGQPPYFYHLNTDGKNYNDVHTGKLGADFYLNKFNTLGVNASITSRQEDKPEQNNYVFNTPDEIIFNEYYTNNFSDEKNFNYDLNSDYKRTWEGTARELTATAGFSSNNKTEKTDLNSSLFPSDGQPYQKNDNDYKFRSVIVQTDFTQPGKKGKFDAGVKSTNRNIDNTQQFYRYNNITDAFDFVPANSDRFKYNEQIAAVYSMYGGKFGPFEYNAGLRAEQTFVNIESFTQNQTIKRNYLSLFPSAFLKYSKGTNDYQFSYSRRVNRPDSRTLNPYVDYSDSLNIRRGNPFINPEFIHSMELSYGKSLESLNITATVYYRHTDDLISRLRTVDSLTGVSTMQMVNFSSSDNYGSEAIIRYTLPFGSIMGSFNIYKNIINGQNVSAELQANATQWNSRLNTSFKLSKSTSAQITGNYIAPMVTVNGRIKGMSGVDVGMKHDFWKNKASLSLNVTDIFWTRQFQFHNSGQYFSADGLRRRESRVGMLTFSYKFGKADNNLFQRKKNQRNQMPEGGGMDMDF